MGSTFAWFCSSEAGLPLSMHYVVFLGDSDYACYVAWENVISEGFLMSLSCFISHYTVPIGLENTKYLILFCM